MFNSEMGKLTEFDRLAVQNLINDPTQNSAVKALANLIDFRIGFIEEGLKIDLRKIPNANTVHKMQLSVASIDLYDELSNFLTTKL